MKILQLLTNWQSTNNHWTIESKENNRFLIILCTGIFQRGSWFYPIEVSTELSEEYLLELVANGINWLKNPS